MILRCLLPVSRLAADSTFNTARSDTSHPPSLDSIGYSLNLVPIDISAMILVPLNLSDTRQATLSHLIADLEGRHRRTFPGYDQRGFRR